MPEINEIEVRVDRRSDGAREVLDELSSLAGSVAGLVVRPLHDDAPDMGKFRDFVPVARVAHGDQRVLDWVAEELVDEFGWRVDIGRVD